MSDAFRTHDGRTLEQAASDLVAREVLCCMSSMVSTLASGAGYIDTDRRNGADLYGLAEQAQDLAAPVLDYEEAASEAGWEHGGDNGGFWFNGREFDSWKAAASSDDAATYATPGEVCDFEGIEPHELEVFEHWAVSQWLGDMLQAKGERVDDDFAGLVVWARTTTGQAISMDAVIERITREMHAAR